jgi:hypothetical protein
MTSLGRRLQRIEAIIRPVTKPGSDPNSAMQRLALARLSTEDLRVLCDIADHGKEEGDWTEIESNAVKALACAFEREVQGAGYGTIREFQRSCGNGC